MPRRPLRLPAPSWQIRNGDGMTRVDSEIVIGRSVDVVFDCVAAQSNEPQYDPHMVRTGRSPRGRAGSRAGACGT